MTEPQTTRVSGSEVSAADAPRPVGTPSSPASDPETRGPRTTPRCTSRAPKTPLTPSLEIEKARLHPLYRYCLEPTAQCELDHGHGDGTVDHDVARRHRNGELLWWDPPVVFVDGEPYIPSTEPFQLLGESVT